MSEEGHWIPAGNGNEAQGLEVQSPLGDGGSVVEGC